MESLLFDELQVLKGFEWTGAEGKSPLHRGKHPPATRFFPGTVLLQRSLFQPQPTSQGIGGGARAQDTPSMFSEPTPL